MEIQKSWWKRNTSISFNLHTPSLLPCSREYSMASIAPADASAEQPQGLGFRRPNFTVEMSLRSEQPNEALSGLYHPGVQSPRLHTLVFGFTKGPELRKVPQRLPHTHPGNQKASVKGSEMIFLQLERCEVPRFWHLQCHICRFV